jgi:hypothetical protein
MILFLFQFPPQYAAISEQHQPAEIIPSYSTLEYTITVSIHTYISLLIFHLCIFQQKSY